MSIYKRYEVKRGGQAVGYIEHVRLGELWRAVAFGMPLYPPPLFSMRGYALEFVRRYGKHNQNQDK